MKASRTDIQLGALYRSAVKFRLSQPVVAAKLVERVGMKPDAAEQLAAHWFSTEALRAYRRRLTLTQHQQQTPG